MLEIQEILAFDFCEDIREEWDVYMEDGCSIREATTLLLDQYEEMLDEEELKMLYLTLAILQLDLEEIDSRVKEETLDILASKDVENYFVENIEYKKLISQIKRRCKR